MALPLCALLLVGCQHLAARPELPTETALPVDIDTDLDRAAAALEAANPGQSGFQLMASGSQALALRVRTAALAQRSLDLQTYIWHDDVSGRFLAGQLLEAADRGVRVRLLLDDLDARDQQYGLAALAAHPNIEVRLFNPFKTRNRGLRSFFEFIGSFRRINRRMHNKSWIADNRVAVVGGRNVGDEYFDVSRETNFVDLDFAMIGPVVRDVSTSFDRYWNSKAAYPIGLLVPGAVTPQALASLRTRVAARPSKAEDEQFLDKMRTDAGALEFVREDWPLRWTGQYAFVADDPEKAAGKGSGVEGSRVLETLLPAFQAMELRSRMISPYFVPSADGIQLLTRGAAGGRDVRVLTNSLAASDVPAVYGGYAQTRESLLKGGVRLWELKPRGGPPRKASISGSSGASLHTKALSIDGRRVFVGSYNLDARSKSLNTEQGVLVESPALGAEVDRLFDSETMPDHSWEVVLAGRGVAWKDGAVTIAHTPEASVWRRFQAWLAGILPVSSQL